MAAKKTERTAIGGALHGTRLDLRLDQSGLAAMIGVTRETVSSWERGRTIPPIEQRQIVLARLNNAPSASLERLAQAFGLSVARPPPSALPMPPKRDAAAARIAVTNAVRAAADDLDVAPSVVRRTIAALLKRMKEASLTNADIELAAVEEKRRA